MPRRGTARVWVDDPSFDLDGHVSAVSMPEATTLADVQRYAARQRSVPLDRSRPLWTAELLAPVTLDDGTAGSVILARFHHAIADGVRLTQVLLAMLDPEVAATVPTVGRTAVAAGPGLSMGTLLSLPGEAVRVAVSTTRNVAGTLVRGAAHPRTAAMSMPRVLQSGLGAIRHPDRWVDAAEVLGARDHRTVNDITAAGKLLVGGSPRTVWTGRPGAAKAVAWSEPVALEPLKRAARSRHVTLNDVLFAALAAALDEYLRGRGDRADEVLWMVPVNLKPFNAALPEDLGNHFALVFLDMPLGGGSPADRIASMHHRMERIKNSDEPVLTFGLQRTISQSPARMATLLTDFFADKAVGILTNVPGPTSPLALGGCTVRQVIGFAPCSGDQQMTATIFTYANTVTIGFATDADLVPDPQTLVDLMKRQLAAIVDGPPSAAGPEHRSG